VVVLPTLAPYPVDYFSTATYYWPNIIENATQISNPANSGTDTYEPTPDDGPFGFGAALKVDGTECIIDGKFQRTGDVCIENPVNCDKGLSFSVWEKMEYEMDIINTPDHATLFSKRYVVSTGGDYDDTLETSVPGFSIYHYGLDLVAVVSTGEDVWELRVRGPVTNKTWQSIGMRWVQPNLDETVTLFPEERGGLEMYVNLEKVGQALLPKTRPGYQPANATHAEVPGAWTILPPVKLPAKDKLGKPVVGEFDGAPVMMFGCHWNQMDEGQVTSPAKFDHFNKASIDEAAIWTRQLTINKTHDETLYFLGGYVKDLEEMTPAKFAEMLKAVDMSDPDQAAAAGSMSNKLMSNPREEAATTTLPTTTSNPGDLSSGSGGSGSGSGNTAQLNGNGASQKLGWKESEKLKQLLLYDLYKGLIQTDGVQDGALPKHLDDRFSNIPVAAKLLSCEVENEIRWKIVQEDTDYAGSSELVKMIEDYALDFMGSANISFYDDTKFFTANNSEYIAYVHSPELFMSIQKMYINSLMKHGPVFNTLAYQRPYKLWSEARALWDNPRDQIRIPTEMWKGDELCKDNPVTFMYAIYPCYSNYAPLRRNPVEIDSQKFVLDSKIITVKMVVNNKTYNAEPGEADMCDTDPQWMKYHPVQVKFYHKSQETARRKVLNHEGEVKTSIDIRKCVVWNEGIGLYGAWDSLGCTTVISDQDSTTCECDRFGTYALAAEKIEKPEAKARFDWLLVGRYIGFCVSLLSLTIFCSVIMVSKHLWEMFHLMRLNTGICYWAAMLFHFISEVTIIQEERHANAAISSLILFFYLCGSYFQFLEAFAEFRAITGGIIGGKTWAYIPLGWASGFIGLGLTWFMYGSDIGTDPDVFIGWENETKMPFFYMNFTALYVGMLLSCVVIFNSSTPQTRKEDVVEDLQVQGQGLAITNFLFCMVWTFAYPAYIKFPGQELPDFYPVFTLFNAWMGLVIFIFLGLSSKRFRFVLSRWRKKCMEKKKKKDVEAVAVPPPLDLATEESISESPSTSRPASSRTTITEAPEDLDENQEDVMPEENMEETPVEDMEDEEPAENTDEAPADDAPTEDVDEEPVEDMDNEGGDEDAGDDMD